jgi:hypothetical protein
VPERGEDFDLAAPRNPRNFSKEFAQCAGVIAKSLGMPQIAKSRFHDLRGIHTTALLDAGIPVRVSVTIRSLFSGTTPSGRPDSSTVPEIGPKIGPKSLVHRPFLISCALGA